MTPNTGFLTSYDSVSEMSWQLLIVRRNYLCPQHSTHIHESYSSNNFLHEMVNVVPPNIFCHVLFYFLKQWLFNMLKWFWDWPLFWQHLSRWSAFVWHSSHIYLWWSVCSCLWPFIVGLFVYCFSDGFSLHTSLCLTCDLQIFSAQLQLVFLACKLGLSQTRSFEFHRDTIFFLFCIALLVSHVRNYFLMTCFFCFLF